MSLSRFSISRRRSKNRSYTGMSVRESEKIIYTTLRILKKKKNIIEKNSSS